MNKNIWYIIGGLAILIAVLVVFNKSIFNSVPKDTTTENVATSTSTDTTIESSITKEEAVSLVQAKYPDLQNYPSENLPPKQIDTFRGTDGWFLGFETLGSGLPGILSAECFHVTNTKEVISTGEFQAGGTSGPDGLELDTCRPVSKF